MAELPEGNEERRKRNMQGLLNFCTELTAVEDSTRPSQLAEMDLERKEFLDNVLAEMTSDVPKILVECISTLLNDASSTADKEAALEELAEHLDDLNHALDFHKLGGCPALIKHLNSSHYTLRHLCAQLIGDICQNNEMLQDKMLSLDALPLLLKMVLSDDERLCRVRAMYAVSCLVRASKKAQDIFTQNGGFTNLLKIIEERHEELLTKAVFLLNSLFQEEACKESITLMGFSRCLASLLCSNAELDDTGREYASKILLQLASSTVEKKVLQKDSNGGELVDYLKNRLIHIEAKSEFQEEESYVTALLEIIT